MTGPERRQTPRTTLEKHAYINIEPNNGGIVLNVSDGGLCFHSFDPVPRNGTIRFWFSDNGHRIEADGTLAWKDETQKGGLRFAPLPPEAREKIREWMSQPSIADQGPAPAGPRPRAFPTVNISPPDTKAVPAGSGPVAVVSPQLKVSIPLSGFSRGLATGLLVSVVVVAAVLFHSHRRELGESLIRLGERFAKPEAQTLTVSAASPATPMLSAGPQPSSPAPRMTSPAMQAASPAQRIVSPDPAPTPVARPEKVAQPEKQVPQPLANPVKLQQAKLEPAAPLTPDPTTVGNAALEVPAAMVAPASSSTGPSVSLPIAAAIPAPSNDPMPAGAGNSNFSGKPGTAAKLELAKQPGVHTEGSEAENADSARELYFEVGKFKNVFQAHEETDKLAQLGFPATAVQKGFLWTNSFHVLVGPYPDEEQAKATHETLVSSGFKPRPFEKGWRNLTLLSALTLNGARTPEGDYTISWESYIGDASVKFMHNSSVVAAADGRWVKRNAKYPRDAYVYRRNADGSKTLLEIHFGGMRQALVFGKAS
jgi:hypothetical protein